MPFPRIPRRIGLLAALLPLLAPGCTDREAAPPVPPRPAFDGQASHARMVTFLEQIRRRSAEENPFTGDVQAKRFRVRVDGLTADVDPAVQVRARYELGNAELRLGRTRDAIRQFEAAYELLPAAADRLTPAHVHLITLQLGLAWLRLGENENCVTANPEEGCLVPISKGGQHRRTEGSTRAIPYLQEVLDATEPDDRLRPTAIWLLNVAHQTLGTWPDGAPADVRLPASAFASSSKMPRFRNVARSAGLDAFNLAGGVAIEDFDGDGRLDVFTTTWDPAGPALFFHNRGDGTFENRSSAANLDGILSGLNVNHADYDNDGDADVLILRGAWLGNAGRHPHSLLRNDGGTFLDVTFAAGLGDVHFPTQAAGWADYDLDGDLDLYVGNESSHEFDATRLRAIGYEAVAGLRAPSQLFRNEGDGTFTDVAEEAGVTNLRFAKGVAWGDLDGDRDPDLYVSNYSGANRLYVNEGDGTFRDVAGERGVDGPFLSFPTWFFDADNDGALDLFVSSYSGGASEIVRWMLDGGGDWEPCLLAKGDGRGGLRNVTEDSGLTVPMLTMGANFGDLTNDGRPELYLGTGSPNYANVVPNLLFENLGDLRFGDATYAAKVGHIQKGHGVAFADLDDDGDLDLFEQLGGAYQGDGFHNVLFENPGTGGRSLTVKVEGRRSNRAGVGARIRASFEDDGERRQVFRHVSTGGSFGSSPLRMHVGVGAAAVVDTLEVFWPVTGETQTFTNVPAGRFVHVIEGDPEWKEIPRAPYSLGGD